MGLLILREVFSRITILPQLPVGGVLTGSIFARKRKMVNLNRHNKSGRIISLALVIAMCLAGAFCVTGCKKEEAASEPETKQENQEDNNIYGDESLGIDAKVDEQLKDYRHILLLGIDNGGRSDLMIVLSINKKTNWKLRILSERCRIVIEWPSIGKFSFNARSEHYMRFILVFC